MNDGDGYVEGEDVPLRSAALTEHGNMLNTDKDWTVANVDAIEVSGMGAVLLLAEQVGHAGEAVPPSCDEGSRVGSARSKLAVRKNRHTPTFFRPSFTNPSYALAQFKKYVSLFFFILFVFQMVYVTITHGTHPGFLKHSSLVT